jgi:hypothetical protein
MDIGTLANLINAMAVTAGVIFAAAQIRYYRQRRQREAMLELVRSFQSAAFTSALRRVLSLPDGADTKKYAKFSDLTAKTRFTWFRPLGKALVCWCFVAKSPLIWSMIFLAVPSSFRGRN